jgi:hypothetical protein
VFQFRIAIKFLPEESPTITDVGVTPKGDSFLHDFVFILIESEITPGHSVA